MKRVLGLVVLVALVGVIPSEAAAPTLPKRVTKLERQVIALRAQVRIAREAPRRFTWESENDGRNQKEAFVLCPAGLLAVGGGVDPQTTAVEAPIAVTYSRPYQENGWIAGAEETAVYSGNWSLRVWVVCLPK